MIIKHTNKKNGKYAEIIIDDDFFPVLNEYGISITKTGYIICQSHKGSIKHYLHHLVLPKKKGFVVDHINTNGFDNRKDNLRYATQSQNLNNRKKQAGVCKYVNSPNYFWQAYIQIEGKHNWLGCFKTKEEAIEARKNAENKIKYPVFNINGKMNII